MAKVPLPHMGSQNTGEEPPSRIRSHKLGHSVFSNLGGQSGNYKYKLCKEDSL